MPLTPPNLDNRNFEDLFKEARSRIPRYVPEWTDWNESDPGIALLQLQAWLADTIIYRLNQVPDLHYIKFLQLIGVEQAPARPAWADLTFTLKEKGAPVDVLIRAGQIVGVSSRELEQPVSFETDRTFRAISARLERVITVAPSSPPTPGDATQDNAVGRAFAPFGSPAQAGALLLLGFRSPLPFSREEIGLQIYQPDEGQALLARQQITVCGPALASAGAPPLAWEWWDGVGWSDLDVTGDETANLTQSGQIYFRVPGQIPAVPFTSLELGDLGDEEGDAPLFYWLRVRLVNNVYTATPRIERILTNTVRATDALTVRDEAVGSSDGAPNQVMLLRHSPVLAEPPLVLEVDEGSGPVQWQAVPDFFGSTPHDAHYVLNRAKGEIVFGDGRRGRIPLAGQFNVVARQYRYGGGAAGNVGAGTITDLTTPIREVEAVTNFRRVDTGKDEEPLAETRLRGPRDLLKTRNRAVTLEDFEHLARETPNALVARARAYVTQDENGVHTINVVVVPQSSDAKPIPSEGTRRLVCQHLDERRLITTQLRVAGPLYHDIDVDVDLVVMSSADLKTVKNSVAQRLTDYFHPLRGGRDRLGWPFGRAVYYSELLHEIMRVEGVLRVDNVLVKKLLIRPDGSSNPDALPYFETLEQANANRSSLINAEIGALAPDCPEVMAEVVPIVQGLAAQFYVAAVYSCCDMPAAEGALVALRQLRISVRYLR